MGIIATPSNRPGWLGMSAVLGAVWRHQRSNRRRKTRERSDQPPIGDATRSKRSRPGVGTRRITPAGTVGFVSRTSAPPPNSAVPTDAGPGEYITSLVLENDRPIPGSGPVVVNQIVRQAVAVVVTVPGLRSPALTIGEATHKVVAGKSIVSVAVDNPGNVRLKPLIDVVLRDQDRAVVSQATVQMDTFYARTDTLVEVPLEALLQPGSYTVRVTIDDAVERVGAKADDLGFVVEAPPATAGSEGGTGLTEVFQTLGQGQMPVWAFIVFAGVVLGAVVVGLVGFAAWRRRRTRIARTPS